MHNADAILETKRAEVRGKIERVTSGLEAIDDAHILDHAITVLTHLATTLEANAQSQIGPPNSVTFLAVDSSCKK